MKFTDTPLLKNIINHTPLPVCIINADLCKIELYNDKFLQLYSQESKDYSEKQLLDFLNSKFIADNALVSKVIAENNSFYGDEFSLDVNHDNKPATVITPLYAPIADDQNQVVKLAIWMTQDSTKKEKQIIKHILYLSEIISANF